MYNIASCIIVRIGVVGWPACMSNNGVLTAWRRRAGAPSKRRRPSYLGRHGQVVGGGPLAEARVVERERGWVAAEQHGGKQEDRRADPTASVGEDRIVSDAGEGASELAFGMEVSTSATKVRANETRVKGEARTRPTVATSLYRCARSDHSAIQSSGHSSASRVTPAAASGQTCLLGVSWVVRVRI